MKMRLKRRKPISYRQITLLALSIVCLGATANAALSQADSDDVTSQATGQDAVAVRPPTLSSITPSYGPIGTHIVMRGMDDDGIAIHGSYALLVEANGDRIIADYRARGELCRPGDTIRFLDEKRAAAGEAHVKTVSKRPDYQPKMAVPDSPSHFKDLEKAKYYELVLDREIPVQAGWMMCNADATGSGFTIRNCIIRHNRARGMMIKGSDGLIEGCTVEGCTQSGIGIWPEIAGTWCDGDYAHNVIVRNNVIRDCHPGHYEGNPFAGAMTGLSV
jgi:hypothetical protein